MLGELFNKTFIARNTGTEPLQIKTFLMRSTTWGSCTIWEKGFLKIILKPLSGLSSQKIKSIRMLHIGEKNVKARCLHLIF